MEQFLELVAEIFEVNTEDISMDTDFRSEVEDWSSLMGFALIIMMEDEYQTRVSVEEFLACRTVGDLYQKVAKT